ncbi:nuclear envelope pore membrane protein POM 121 [Astyanax mexicanus]|uniref:nuclear envelope pore membrane protein POM 121 n=1 Tax=Astyanax mexicanus TaxID=7994 RepID=UPI0020CB12A0|nr:nuclear envelope pore membrane protein POM 121 [Astyanax mexicanus]
MSPEDKRRLAFTSAALLAVALFLLVLSYIPTYLYILLFFVGFCGVGYYKAEEFRLFDRLGLNPRRGLSVPPALLRCLPGGSLRGAPASVRNKNRANKGDARNSLAASVERHFVGSSVQRREAFSDTAFSPRDLLMGSYLAKPESPHGAGRPVGPSGLQAHPGEQLRERLVRPNHGVPTPNRRLSFGDPVGTTGRFTITPQRHYPLQQTGTSSVGVLPPAQWDGFRKKNVLTQRNTPTHSPVTVKIARPDSASRSTFFDQLNSPGALTSPGFGVQADPCSRETVLNVLRESRKRDVDDEDKSHATGQKSKRRRHDSSGSSQSAFETLLANGAPSQLVPKPGSLKRGMNTSVLEESTMKRSRTSSISSVSGAPTSFGVPGSVRNPIRSSYSSSQGYPQRRAASSLSLSPLTSPASSRCQTPERAAKKPREEDITSPSSASSMKSDKTATDIVPGSGKRSPAPEATVSTISDSGGSSGKRKRKIQLVSTRRGDQISMPPPPELGYTVTVKDLDMEKKAALSQIQKVLEEPEPEKPAPASAPGPVPTPSISLFSQVAPASSTAANPGVSAPSVAPLSAPATSTTISAPAPTPTIDLTVAPASTASPAATLISAAAAAATTTTSSTLAAPAMSQANPLLESLKNMRNNSQLPSPLAATPAAPATPVMAKTPASLAQTGPGSGVLKSEPALAPPQPSVSTSLAPATHSASSTPSAFAQILAQPLHPTSITFTPPSGSTLFSLKPQTAPASAAPTPTASITPTVAVSSAANPAPSGFKPIFGAATTAPATAAEVKPTQPVFKPIFGSATEGGLSAFGQPTTTTLSSAPASQSSTLLFGSLTNTQPAAASVASSTPATQTSSNSLFGSWPSASAAPAPAPAVNSTFQFGAQAAATPSSGLGAAATTTSSSGSANTFQFGAVKPTQTAPAAATQSTFMFGQTPAAQNSTTTTFGGFGLTNNTATTTASAPTTQATFGSSTFSTSTSFPNATTQAPAAAKPFTFGAGSGASAAAAPFPFGAPASTAAPSFGPQSQTTFGSTTAAPTFGTQSQPTFGGTTAAPSFGTQSQPTFGSTTAAPSFGTTTQPTFGNASSGFSFANTTTPSVAPAFGATTQTAAPVPAPTFTFGAASATPQNNAQSAPAPAASGGFNFTASLSGAQFATPAPAAQTQGFPFGNNNADNKLTFGTSTPAFGNSSTPIPFGSPGTPVPGFTASPFNTPSATFSIGAGSKPSGSRQRLQARRQHVRKK